MLSQAFEIKVGLLGHVSVGKTTGLNAILQEKFSEVSMKRTTAGINLFRISSLAKSAKRAKLSTTNTTNDEAMDWQEVNEAASTGSDTSYAKASDTLQETTSDNARLRTTNELQEKVFDIELDEPLLKDMRDDTRLVLVDIPGTNEAGTQKIYQDYVSSTWDTFDAMIVVMDAKQGVNTDEQVALLNFIKKNLDTKKDIPIIVVCNKVDDPDDDELVALVQEAQQEVEKIFEVNDRSQALEIITGRNVAAGQDMLSPIFLPTSFENAFLYRTASRLPIGELKRLDKIYIDKIGHEEMGKFKWKKLSDEKKYELVHQIVSDPAQYKERLEASNFHKLLAVLQYFLGGKETQEKLIEKQLDVALSKMSIKTDEGRLFTDQLIAVFDRSKALGKDTSSLVPKFWALYEDLKAEALAKLESNPLNVTALDEPMKELIKYAQHLQNKLIQSHASIAEEENEQKIVEAMKDLIKRQVALTIGKAGEWKPQSLSRTSVLPNTSCLEKWTWYEDRWYNDSTGHYFYGSQDTYPADLEATSWVFDPASKVWKSKYSNKEVDGAANENPAIEPFPGLSNWPGMSPKDWSTVVGSIMLLSSRKVFCDTFGQEIIDLEWMARHANFSKPPNYCCDHKGTTCGCNKLLRVYHDYAGGAYINGVFAPYTKVKYDRAVQIKVPDSPSDPSHWGHLAWLFCEYMESLEA